MLSQQEISDRLEITDVLLRYTHAVDSQNWDEFRECFTEDAFIDYTAMGGIKGDVDAIVAFLQESMPRFVNYQHMIGPPLLHIDGDTATARSICHNPMVFDRDGESGVFVCALWYVDQLRRTPAGWRMSERVEERSHVASYAATPAPVPAAQD